MNYSKYHVCQIVLSKGHLFTKIKSVSHASFSCHHIVCVETKQEERTNVQLSALAISLKEKVSDGKASLDPHDDDFFVFLTNETTMMT